MMPAKNEFFNTIFSPYYVLKLHLHNFSKMKSQKESQISRNQGFSYYFCTMIEGSGSRAGSWSWSWSIPLTSGSGSRRPKNMWIRWIRIRIRNTGNLDVHHWFALSESAVLFQFWKSSFLLVKTWWPAARWTKSEERGQKRLDLYSYDEDKYHPGWKSGI